MNMMISCKVEQVCRQFSLAEIQLATGGFSDEHLIGKGGFGKVYKGLIDSGSVIVAIKRLSSNSNQGEREFVTETQTLTKLRHQNLVSLIGFCNEQKEMILVYEYVPNGSLSDHLHRLSHDHSSLTWIQRLKICIGAGRGLDYLHSSCSIIHRDVKSSNILLDEDFTAKVSDFGLAKHISTDISVSVSASVKGSFGYFDPCYFTTGRLTMASDTYAFGVVMLEVLSGKPAVNPKLAEDELCLTMWAKEKIRNGKGDQIVAPNLRGKISKDCLKTFLGLAKRCLHHETKKRPTMAQAVAQLELALQQQERRGPTRMLNAFWNRVIPSGSTKKDDDEGEVNKLPILIPAFGEEAILQYKQRVDMLPTVEELSDRQNASMLPIDVLTFQLAELRDITNEFSLSCLLANESSGGSLYHGVFKNGQHVAIKKLYKKSTDRAFLAQVATVSRLRHEHVVKLLGYCVEDGLQILVYEFDPRRSLHHILHGEQGMKGLELELVPSLSWDQRIKIALGVARGLFYIHGKALIHRAIRSSNVILFDDEIAKITCLHLSKECSCKEAYLDERHPLAFPPCYQYHPPEFMWPGHSQKGDVYSFGVVLYELLGGHTLAPQLARSLLSQDKVHKIVDASLMGDYPPKAVAKMAAVAAMCLEREADSRPDMSSVIRELEIASRETQHFLQQEQYSPTAECNLKGS